MMKKITFLFTMLFMVVGSWQTQAQISIGSGTTTGQGLPVEPFYGYSYSQVIYLASEINASGDITTLTWDFAGSSIDSSNDWTIYIGHTTKSEFASDTDWEDVANLTQVFSGTVGLDANNKVVVDITDFAYNGTDNLVIAVDENASGYDGSSDDFNCSSVSGNRGIMYRNDTTNPDPTAPPTASYLRSYIANIVLGGIAQACPAPSDLAVSNIDQTTADLSWTDNAAGGATYLVEWRETGAATWNSDTTAAGATTYALTGLTAATEYEWQLTADCGGGDTSSAVQGSTFMTDCPVYTPDYTQTFDSFVPTCWDEANSGDATTGPSDIGSSPWASSTVFGNDVRINLYYNNRSDWVLSPYFDLSAGGYEVVIDVAVTNWNNSDPDAMGSDDYVMLLYTEDGTNWNEINAWTAADNLTNSLTTFNFSLSTTGSQVQFGILASDGSTDDSEDYDFHIDNFKVKTAPTCPAPTNLSTANITATSAEYDWVENGTATAWNFEIKAGADFTPGNSEYDISGNTTIHPFSPGTTLQPETTYYWYVQADCGGGDTSSWVGSSFTTLPLNDACADATPVYALPYTNSQNASGATNNDGFINDCGLGGMNDGVWYTFTVDTAGDITVEITPTGWDPQLDIYTGACGAFTCVDQVDDGGTSGAESITFTATAGTQYWVNIGYWSSTTDGSEGPFDISITTTGAVLGIANNLIDGFNMYPNPVTNTLNLKAQDSIDAVSIYNMLGQEVLKSTPSSTQAQMDMTMLPTGAYIVKVQVGDQIGSYNLLKQ